ncbi:MAG TPA: PmoA family protein [Candidatus Saccharimonadales bacterium]|nr:PmoA family protein [Candidatus Saccharimonadales bacterium]
MGRVRTGEGVAAIAISVLLMCSVAAKENSSADRIRVIPNEEQRRVDILVDGQPFTAYVWPERLAKPVLYPLRTAKGTIVTRGFPLEPRSGERVDHPHHTGSWFNYGNVNGFDFWNNSETIKPQDAPKMGNVRQRAITLAKSGRDQGELEVGADWITGKQQIILKEHTRFVFRGGPDFRSIDRITTLQALGDKVVFNDDKEGVLGMRVTRELEAPSDKPEVFTDASGRPTTVAKLDNTGVNGVYLTSEGKEGDAAWGTRGRWCNLSGTIGNEQVTITIFDHPANPGFPTYWHTRGYGLFAANPLGQRIFSNGKQELNFALAPKESVTFRYRILISSEVITREKSEAAYQDFASQYR